MKRIIICLIGFSFFIQPVFGEITLTKEQYDNIDILDEKIKERWPTFKGFNGSRTKMKVVGISEETVEQEIRKIDLGAEVKKKKDAKDAKELKKKTTIETLTQKLKDLGLNDDEISILIGGE